jgi:5-deoxy-glucuronate isomerase
VTATTQGLTSARPLHRRAGSLSSHPFELVVTQGESGWSWASLRVLALGAGGSHAFSTGEEELLLVPLNGSCSVSCDGEAVALEGRQGVLAGPTDFAYLPLGSEVVVASDSGGRFALPGARAERRLRFSYQLARAVPVELRGAGPSSRRVVNYCMPGTFEADRLIACEVVTPGGNWSSWPPHKHDEDRPGEAKLEEIYYFEVASGPGGEPGVAYQRVYGTAERPIDVLVEVRSGDIVLIPHGYHGPSMAAPGYDLYYLNVMAGPGERAWLVSFDPAHDWVRAAWEGQPVDPRLLGGSGERVGRS